MLVDAILSHWNRTPWKYWSTQAARSSLSTSGVPNLEKSRLSIEAVDPE